MAVSGVSAPRNAVAGAKKNTIDFPFLMLFAVLQTIGLVMLFSASHVNAYYQHGDSYYFISQQLKWTLLGVVAIVAIVIFVTPALLKVAALPSLGVGLVLMILVAFAGTERNDATRWLEIGGFSLQPSEIVKLAIILSFAYLIVRIGPRMKTFKYGVLPFALILGVFGFLLYKQPHYSAMILIFLVGITMLLIGGVPVGWFAAAGAVAAAGAGLLIWKSSYALSRVQLWLHPESDPLGKGYQTLQSLYAVGSGGLFGVGLGQSRQKYLYIPEPQNDFIFAITCEELGLIGALIIIALFAMLVWRGLVIAMRAPDRFSALVITGIMVKVGAQALLNIGVVTNTIPNTGISLPFFSYGGTALLIQMAEMGIVLALSRYCVNQKQ